MDQGHPENRVVAVNQAFVVMAEVRVVRELTVVADGHDSAVRLAMAQLGDKARIMESRALNFDRSADDAFAAVRHLMRRAFLPIGGMDATVSDWLAEAVAGNRSANDRLAVAGLRLRTDETLAVGSPVSVPQLGHWFQKTRWERGALHPALMLIPGARRVKTPMKMAGVLTRAVALPVREVMGALA